MLDSAHYDNSQFNIEIVTVPDKCDVYASYQALLPTKYVYESMNHLFVFVRV